MTQMKVASVSEILLDMISAAQVAGNAALQFFELGRETIAKVTMKSGDSPVTEADFAANAVLVQKLRERWPGFGWVSEEDADSPVRLSCDRLFIVDPIDGTRAFISGKTEWCVSVALIESQRAIAGVIHLPALGLTYSSAENAGAFLNGKRLNVMQKSALAGSRFAGPKSIFDSLQRKAGDDLHFAPRIPSLAYRLVQVASGEIDLAAASTGSHDWDIAAADIILSEAGAILVDEQGERLSYNRVSLERGILYAAYPALASLMK